jgi:hypothetical protein
MAMNEELGSGKPARFEGGWDYCIIKMAIKVNRCTGKSLLIQ